MISGLLRGNWQRHDPFGGNHRHPAWARHRRAYQKRNPPVCHNCGPACTGGRLDLHHIRYDDRYPTGDVRRLLVPDEWLMWLCQPLHDAITSLHTRGGTMTPEQATDYVLTATPDERRAIRRQAWWGNWWDTTGLRLAGLAALSIVVGVVYFVALYQLSGEVEAFANFRYPGEMANKFGGCVVAGAVTVAGWRFRFVRRLTALAIIGFLLWLAN